MSGPRPIDPAIPMLIAERDALRAELAALEPLRRAAAKIAQKTPWVTDNRELMDLLNACRQANRNAPLKE